MNTGEVARALEHVYDPELGIDVVSLGLVYAIESDGLAVRIGLTLTSEGCPMGEALFHGVVETLRFELGVEQVEVEILTEPPWNVEMLADTARHALGLPPLATVSSAPAAARGRAR